MEMLLEIYRNGKKVNEMKSNDPANIYKHIAQIYFAKDTKRATKTKITHSLSELLTITQVFDQYKTQLPDTTYIYKYKFVGVSL